MFGTSEVLDLVEALRRWEREGFRLPGEVLKLIEGMEQTLQQFEGEMDAEAWQYRLEVGQCID